MSDFLFDFAAAWAERMQRHPSERLDLVKDRVFWQEYAERYDERVGGGEADAQTLAIIGDLVHPADTFSATLQERMALCLSADGRLRDVAFGQYAIRVGSVLRHYIVTIRRFI